MLASKMKRSHNPDDICDDDDDGPGNGPHTPTKRRLCVFTPTIRLKYPVLTRSKESMYMMASV